MNWLIFQFVYLSMFYYYSVCFDDTAICKLCKCKDDLVNCYKTHLSYIPQLPNNTRKFLFTENHLPVIDNRTFENITHLNITYLKLNYNKITRIELNTFRNLKSVINLTLSGNKLLDQSLYNLVTEFQIRSQQISTTLYKLVLRNIGLNTIPEGLFLRLPIVCLNISVLDFSNNNLTKLNMTQFKPLRQLKDLYLNQNKIKSVIFDRMDNLHQLNFQRNSFKKLPNFCKNSSDFPHLQYLTFENNFMKRIYPNYLICLKKLIFLNVQQNRIGIIESNSFQGFPSLINLMLSYQMTKTPMHIEKHAFSNEHIQVIDLYHNNLFIENVHILAFNGCTNLRHLILSNNNLRDTKTETFTKLNKILVKLTSLEHLELIEIKLTYIPTAIQNLTRLINLDLYRNKITTWSDGFWKQNTQMTYIGLGRNMITKITPEMLPESFRKRLKYFALHDNPLECECDNLWLVNWIKDNTKIFPNFPNGYHCLNMTERVCLKDNPFYTSIIGVSCSVIVILAIISIVYNYRWLIKYQIYIWRHQPKLLNNMAAQQFIYDVFVSFCVEDRDWVLNNLVPYLEEENNMKLCIHERDFLCGKMIIDNIVESIENSRRVLIILSNNFARSEWCQFEMTLAQKHVLNQVTEPLSVVLLQDIGSENMTPSLYALLKTTTYITWYDDVEHIHLFWDRLKRSLTNI